MTEPEEQYYRVLSNRLLLAHGFLPDPDSKTWSKRSRTQWAVAEFDSDYPMLHLLIYKVGEHNLIFETNIDLSISDETILEKVIVTFDLT